MSEIKVHSEMSRVVADNSKRYVKNTKSIAYERDLKQWAPNEIIEVNREEANHLHDEGFLVLDQDDFKELKHEEAEKAKIEVKE